VAPVSARTTVDVQPFANAPRMNDALEDVTRTERGCARRAHRRAARRYIADVSSSALPFSQLLRRRARRERDPRIHGAGALSARRGHISVHT
jgi:hypothetical protein